MTFLYYELTLKIKRDNRDPRVQLIALGDKYQSIYKFQDSDERFLI